MEGIKQRIPRPVAIIRDRVLCSHDKEGFFNFFRLSWHTIENGELKAKWYHKVICDRLQVEVERIHHGLPRTKDIIICVPPRTLKSSIVAIMFNAWCWTKYPEIAFLTCSHSNTLSEQHSIKTKKIIESRWYRERWGNVFELDKRKNTNMLFQNTKGGERQATSVGGTVTGVGGMVLIPDDLIDVEKSKSEAARKKAVRMYKETLFNRVNDPLIGVRILIQQRTHDDDVVGTLLKENPDQYDTIIIPAELPVNDKMQQVQPKELEKFYVNGLFDHERFPMKVLSDYKAVMNDYPEQYLQDCKKPGGNILKPREWMFEFDLSELIKEIHAAGETPIWNYVVDGAYTKNHDNDPTVVLCYCIFNNRAYIRAVLREWMEYVEAIRKIKQFCRETGYNYDSLIFVEPKASGKSFVSGLIFYQGLNATESYAPELDKVAMAWSITPELKAKRVGINKDMEGKEGYYKELELFPNTTHDDQVDTTVMIVKNGLRQDVLASG